MAKFRVAVIGSTASRRLRARARCRLEVLRRLRSGRSCRTRSNRAAESSGTHGPPRPGPTTGKCSKNFRPQVVAVCPRWVDQHRDMVLACAEYGCHMYLEKPLCRTLGEADEMLRACRNAGVENSRCPHQPLVPPAGSGAAD
ncbi:MAG UNVERIFIED_CONTAM: Gfo/Idh/MocA family oxidoreductase [Planctomycetaceae bacterium]